MENNSLTQFGTSFQSKIITSCLLDTMFLQTVMEVLQPEYFESDANSWIVKETYKYFIKYKTTPTLEALKIAVDDVENDVLKLTIVEALKDSWRQREANDLPFVQEKTLEFCKNQVLKSAIMESVTLLENQNYDGIKTVIDNAMKAGTPVDIGHDYNVGIEERLTKATRITIKTPWDIIDEVMDGGLGEGELGVVVAPAGVGKTWLLQTIAAGAIKRGFTVVHYTLELNETYVGLRYDTIFSGISTQNIKFQKEEVKKIIDSLEGRMIIKYYPTRAATVNTLSAHLKQLELKSIKPDLVIVDYADILRDNSGMREVRHQLGAVYEDLRGLAGEFKVPIWTASQANRSALEEEVIEATKIAESYSKIMIADFVLSISRQAQDKLSHTARCHIIKNRFGIDGITYPMNMNTNLGKIEIYAGNSQPGKEQQGKMDNSEEFKRQLLASKYKDMKKTEVEGFE
jgi:archaellum biogenesis ATPase FlaH